MISTENYSPREWRQAGGHRPTRSSASQPIHDVVPSPTVSVTRKRQKTLHSDQANTGLSSKNYIQYPPTAPAGNPHYISHNSSGVIPSTEHAEATNSDPLIGRKVWTRWPEDNNLYEAVITDYNPAEGRHSLVYDINSGHETWEWVNLKEMSAEDILWEGEDPGITYRGVRGGPGRGVRKLVGQGGYPHTGRGRGPISGPPKMDVHQSQNGFAKTLFEEIELFNTESLVEEVERVFALSQPDPHELEKAKRMLREHEQALIEAISRLADTSDTESGNETDCFLCDYRVSISLFLFVNLFCASNRVKTNTCTGSDGTRIELQSGCLRGGISSNRHKLCMKARCFSKIRLTCFPHLVQ